MRALLLGIIFAITTGCTFVTAKGNSEDYIITVTTTRKNVQIEKSQEGQSVAVDGKLLPIKETQ